MDARKLAELRKDLTSFLDDVAGSLGHPRRRRWCDAYLRGLLLDGHRKSVGPMAARLRAIERGDEDDEQALQQFLDQSPWDEQELLDALHARVARRFGGEGDLIIDDTGFPKQGAHSVGVARQSTGTLGKVASGRVAVTLPFATPTQVVALDAQSDLPEAWTADAERRTAAGVPESVADRPKWRTALAVRRRAQANGLRGVVPADSAFGTATEFRQELDRDGRAYCVGIGLEQHLGPPHLGGRPGQRLHHLFRGSLDRLGLALAHLPRWGQPHLQFWGQGGLLLGRSQLGRRLDVDEVLAFAAGRPLRDAAGQRRDWVLAGWVKRSSPR